MYNFYYNIYYSECQNGQAIHFERLLIKSNTSLVSDTIKKLIMEKLGEPEMEINLAVIQQIDIDKFVLLGGDRNALQLTVENLQAVPSIFPEKNGSLNG